MERDGEPVGRNIPGCREIGLRDEAIVEFDQPREHLGSRCSQRSAGPQGVVDDRGGDGADDERFLIVGDRGAGRKHEGESPEGVAQNRHLTTSLWRWPQLVRLLAGRSLMCAILHDLCFFEPKLLIFACRTRGGRPNGQPKAPEGWDLDAPPHASAVSATEETPLDWIQRAC